MIGLTILMGIHRNEYKPLWTGIFYDEIVLDPYKGEMVSLDSVVSVHCFRKGK